MIIVHARTMIIVHACAMIIVHARTMIIVHACAGDSPEDYILVKNLWKVLCFTVFLHNMENNKFVTIV